MSHEIDTSAILERVEYDRERLKISRLCFKKWNRRLVAEIKLFVFSVSATIVFFQRPLQGNKLCSPLSSRTRASQLNAAFCFVKVW